MTLLPFVQLDFPGLLGLPDGRYLAREPDGEHVLILEAAGVTLPPGRLRHRAQQADPDESPKVPMTRVTVVGPERYGEKDQAMRWLKGAAADPARRAVEVRQATRLLNKALNALRAGARDPLVQDVGASRALAIRLGFGLGHEVAEGRWQEARELAAPRRGRLEGIDPQMVVAAVLAGRRRVHPGETLLERARLDIEQGRTLEARFGLQAAREALAADSGDAPGELAERIDAAEEKLGQPESG